MSEGGGSFYRRPSKDGKSWEKPAVSLHVKSSRIPIFAKVLSARIMDQTGAFRALVKTLRTSRKFQNDGIIPRTRAILPFARNTREVVRITRSCNNINLDGCHISCVIASQGREHY